MSSSSEETIELFVIDLHKTIYIYIYISFLKSGRLFESCTSRFCKGTAGSNSAGFGEMKVLLGPWLPSDASILRNQRRHNGAVETFYLHEKQQGQRVQQPARVHYAVTFLQQHRDQWSHPAWLQVFLFPFLRTLDLVSYCCCIDTIVGLPFVE